MQLYTWPCWRRFPPPTFTNVFPPIPEEIPAAAGVEFVTFVVDDVTSHHTFEAQLRESDLQRSKLQVGATGSEGLVEDVAEVVD